MTERFPGVGVMIQMLYGENGGELIEASKGKKITQVWLDEEDNGRLRFIFNDGSRISIFDNGQSCCENRYIKTDDNLADFSGAEFLNAGIQDAPDEPDEYDTHEVQFLIIHTSKGDFTVAAHNEHNGYYGGFWMKVVRDCA